MNFVADEGHCSISGQTGAGKTYLANQIHRSMGKTRRRLSIFLNTQHEQYIYGYKVRSWRELKGRLKQGCNRYGLCFNYLPSSTSGAREHQSIVKQVIGEDTATLLVTDEAHEIASTHDEDTSLHRAVKRGRRWNTKNLVISQRPSAVSNDVLTQCKYHVWVGTPNMMEEQYLRGHGFPVRQMRSANTHEITVVSGGDVVENYPGGV